LLLLLTFLLDMWQVAVDARHDALDKPGQHYEISCQPL